MKVKLQPKEAGEFITQNAQYVKILPDGVDKVAKLVVEKLQDGSLSIDNFSQHELHPNPMDKDAIDWIFVIDTLNFCFWTNTNKEKWTLTYNGKAYTGYFALLAAIKRAKEEGYDITNPTYYQNITLDDVKHIFRGDNQSVLIPLLQSRQDCLKQAGKKLMAQFGGTFKQCISEANGSAQTLLDIIIENFSFYADEADYENTKVCIYKRAQILIGDIWACYRGVDLGAFSDIDAIAMFADYRIPQVFIHFKVFEYADSLVKQLEGDEILENGSKQEVEIRGCSIEAVQRILAAVKKLLPEVKSKPTGEKGELVCNAIVIDHFLWDYRRAHEVELNHIPFHKTYSVYY